MSASNYDKNKAPVLYICHKAEPVSQGVADFERKYRQNQRYRARSNGKCGTALYQVCRGDCYHCYWRQEGHNMLSFATVFGEFGEMETPDFTNTEKGLDEKVTDQAVWTVFYERLDKVVPNEATIFRLRAAKCSQREIGEELEGVAQTTLSYRIKKLDKYIRQHKDEIKNLLF